MRGDIWASQSGPGRSFSSAAARCSRKSVAVVSGWRSWLVASRGHSVRKSAVYLTQVPATCAARLRHMRPESTRHRLDLANERSVLDVVREAVGARTLARVAHWDVRRENYGVASGETQRPAMRLGVKL